MHWKRIISIVAFISGASCLTVAASDLGKHIAPGDTTRTSYEEEINAWHQKRIASLERPQGWLSLVALDWLREGPNELASIGTLTLTQGAVQLEIKPGVVATIAGKPFTSGAVRAEGGKERPDRVEVGSRMFIIIKRGDRYAVRMWDSNAESLKHFPGIARFPVETRWQIKARWEAYATPKKIKVESVIPGYLEDYDVPGVAIFTVDGKECRLEPVGSGSETLFFIFADKTNGKETYGAGRFLYADAPKDGSVVLDFNKAHNPPCAFTPYATCPLPPASNRLSVSIPAGEKNFGGH